MRRCQVSTSVQLKRSSPRDLFLLFTDSPRIDLDVLQLLWRELRKSFDPTLVLSCCCLYIGQACQSCSLYFTAGWSSEQRLSIVEHTGKRAPIAALYTPKAIHQPKKKLKRWETVKEVRLTAQGLAKPGLWSSSGRSLATRAILYPLLTSSNPIERAVTPAPIITASSLRGASSSSGSVMLASLPLAAIDRKKREKHEEISRHLSLKKADRGSVWHNSTCYRFMFLLRNTSHLLLGVDSLGGCSLSPSRSMAHMNASCYHERGWKSQAIKTAESITTQGVNLKSMTMTSIEPCCYTKPFNMPVNALRNPTPLW